MKKRYGQSIASEFLTRAQLTELMGLPRRVVDRLIATGELTQYRSGPGIGHGGQRIFYARSQVEMVKRWVRGRKRR